MKEIFDKRQIVRNFNRHEVVSSEIKFEGKVFKVLVDKVKFPTGEVHEREVIKHLGAVGIVPLTQAKEVILVEQYRHPTSENLLEIPAGKLGLKEDPLECVTRELEEETGYRSQKIVKLAEFYTTPGHSNELFHLYLGTDLSPGKKEEGREEEKDLKVIKLPLEEVLAMISSGEIKDAKTIAGLTLAERYLNQSKVKSQKSRD